jgi:uncharacterized membrane protein (DUF4010 family)
MTAFIFGLLFGFFVVLTNFVVSNYGYMGVNILSFLVGITDIDPYIINLFQRTNDSLHVNTIVNAAIIASASNNFIKMIYSVIVGDRAIKWKVIIGFSLLIAASIASTFFIG